MSDQELLKALASAFFAQPDGSLEWGYVEGTSIKDALGEEVEASLKKYVAPFWNT